MTRAEEWMKTVGHDTALAPAMPRGMVTKDALATAARPTEENGSSIWYTPEKALCANGDEAKGNLQKAILGRVGDYDVRRCDRDDIDAVIGINAKTLPEHYSDYFYFEVLSEFPEAFLVAERSGEVVGYIMCRSEYGFSHLKKLGLARRGHVISVAVLEEHRGKGIGTRLITMAHEELAKKSASECYLEVRVSNTGAIALYESLGYRATSRLEAYYKDGEPALLMAIPLEK